MNLKFLITRSIFENSNITQRELSSKFKVSLGKINLTIKELVDDKLIVKKDDDYKLTASGKNLLEKHKVDGAVIFACGMGVRLAPLTYDTPKSFITIKGKKMIERQIEQLIEAGISDITIMVGYLKEKFDYLIDKYGVKLVYNREYKYKNTLSTFYVAREILRNKNMYICVSDVYIEENIYHRYEVEPYYIGAFYEDCKNEWRYIVNSKNEIKSVAVGGKNDYCLVGPCFLTKEFSHKFIPMIEMYYNKTSTDNFYWEDVLVQNFAKLPKMYLYKLDKDIIFEFDTLQDIKNFDHEIESYGSKAVSFVSETFHIKDSEVKNITCVKEGMTNRSYRFTYDGTEYFARVPGDSTDEFISRKSEGEILDKLQSKGITEEVIYFDKKTGYKISKSIKNARNLNIENKKELEKCMALYRKFHSLGIKVKATCNMTTKIDEYLNIIKEKNIIVPYEDFDKIVKEEQEIKKKLSKMKRPETLCHGDPNPYNVLVTKDSMKLIDFEYGGMADPISDIALFGVYVGFDEEKTFELYKMYKKAKGKSNFLPKSDKEAETLISYYMVLSGFYNAVWAIVRGALGDADYGTFGMNGYRAFKNLITKISHK